MKNLIAFLLLLPVFACAQTFNEKNWNHLSTVNGDLEIPNSGKQQTSSLIVDVDNDDIQEFIITERTSSPSVTMYKMNGQKWDRYEIDSENLHIEAGSAKCDIDGDGDMDVVFGGDWKLNLVWWWENPYPNFDKNINWKRHLIKTDGMNQHHDQIFGDFYGDGHNELVFWNQGAGTLYIAAIPKNPYKVRTWDYKPIYTYSSDSRMEPPGILEGRNNAHEGLAKMDIDQDGIIDIVGGGRWFKYLGDGKFQSNIIDASYTYSRCVAGQFIEGKRPEVILVAGDGIAPMFMYEWQEGTWVRTTLIENVDHGHSLDVIDFNGDGHLDIFNGEMRLNNNNQESKLHVLLGDGKGNFNDYLVAEGFGNHESKVTDFDNDGDYDILGKPYNWETPRIDIWINKEK